MNRVLRFTCSVACVLALWACGSEGDVALVEDQQDAVETDQTVDAGAEGEAQSPEVSFDAGADERFLPDLAAEVDSTDLGLTPGPGAPGYPCESGDECDDGFCIQTIAGKLCSQICIDECPFDWECAPASQGPDPISVCVPRFVDICRPCEANAECWTDGIDAGQACVGYGDAGFFCGGACSLAKDCPGGFDCQVVKDVSGALVNQCVLKQGECACGQGAIDEGAATVCFTTNEHGSCQGKRSCMASGLTDCSAVVPKAETCNDDDDDCDGEVDEGTGGGECTNENGYGKCKGTLWCANGVPSCDAPAPAPEVCDGLDNNCNGQTDEGFPDTNGDGIKDCLVSDKDGDGVLDVVDNCPTVANSGQDDFDLDSKGDACDLDDDNDLTADAADCAPLDPDVSPKADEECNGIDDNCNLLVDEGFPDSDYDKLADCEDEDDDNDSSPDAADCEPLDPSAFPGAEDLCNGKDDDCDDDVDEGFPDQDSDGEADCFDPDVDGDGAPNVADNCPTLANEDQADMDGDEVGDACDVDMDGDAIPDAADNCQGLKNPSQADADDDGDGDACDDDDDGDGDPDTLDCAPLNAAVYNGAAELCNALDDDCDGSMDEGLGTYKCGMGQCEHSVSNCTFGKQGTCNPFKGASAEACDGKDNDCDGIVDEDLGFTYCGIGQCWHSVPNCEAGAPVVCDPLQGSEDETCDGQDNDCDGKTDEELPFLACGKGKCFHVVNTCVGGVVYECNPLDGASKEVCDGVDNDCDDSIDEELGTVTCGVGQCLHTMNACANGVLQPCNPFQGSLPEACDGIDNDCDGIVDDDLGVVSCGIGQCMHQVKTCVNGLPQLCDPKEGAFPEVCDGFDNDCNGPEDDGLGTAACGLGACAHIVDNCVDGKLQECDPLEGSTPESCDGVDNDCDGTIDEGSTDFDKDGQADCVDEDDDNDGDLDVGDCAPLDAEVGPSKAEVCFNNKDDDCSSVTPDQCLLASCYALHQAKPALPNGQYTVDPTGGDAGDAYAVECDMTTDGGGWNVVNDFHVVNVQDRHAYKEWEFKVSDFKYATNVYKFENVYVNIQFAGELDDGGNNVNTYFNGQFVNKWQNGACNATFVQIGGWPKTYLVSGASFKLATQPEGDVDVDCGNGQSYGINRFELLRFRVVPL